MFLQLGILQTITVQRHMSGLVYVEGWGACWTRALGIDHKVREKLNEWTLMCGDKL
jgi:hypothetical protein